MKNAGVVTAVLLSMSFTLGTSCALEETGPAPTFLEAGEAEYHGIYDSPVRLVDGRYEGEPFVEGGASRPTLQLYPGLIGTGEIDVADGEEAVVVLAEHSGGSGLFIYLALLSRIEGEIRNTGTVLVGDRVQIRSMAVVSGEIRLEVVQHGQDAAACCPREKAVRTWAWEEGSLEEMPIEIAGMISVADLAGIEWVLIRIGQTGSVTGDPAVTIVFEDTEVSGSSGCNRYFAALKERSPMDIRISGIGATRMACDDEAMRLESRYLELLGSAVGYSFSPGRLLISCWVIDRLTLLTFERTGTE